VRQQGPPSHPRPGSQVILQKGILYFLITRSRKINSENQEDLGNPSTKALPPPKLLGQREKKKNEIHLDSRYSCQIFLFSWISKFKVLLFSMFQIKRASLDLLFVS
jgi:hypothetical protein